MEKWLGETMHAAIVFISVFFLGLVMHLLQLPFWSFMLVSVLLFALTVYATFNDNIYHKKSYSLIPIIFFIFLKDTLKDGTQLFDLVCYLIPTGIILLLVTARFIWCKKIKGCSN